MELEVLRHVGIPEDSFISVRAGSTKRQAQLSSLDRPLTFPAGPEECGTIKVEVLNLLGSARFAYDPNKQEHPVGLKAAGGGDDDSGMQVVFNLRKSAAGLATNEARAADGSRPATPGVGEDSGGKRPAARDLQKEQLARDYMERHGLTSFMQYLMQGLMKDKPADPFAFLQKQVTKRMVSEMSKNAGLFDEDQAVQNSAPDAAVSVEELAALEREAAAASEQMRQDNKKLREAAAQMKAKYWKLLEDNQLGAIREVPDDGVVEDPNLLRGEHETPQVAAYREIAAMRRDVTTIAAENHALVEELARMRATIDAVRDEVDGLSRTN